MTEPILIELDEPVWNEQLDRVAQWLGNVLTTQAAFRKHAEDTVERIAEPHIRTAIKEIADTARKHEEQVEALYSAIGRDPAPFRQVAGTAMAKAGEAVAALQGALGGAVGAWRDLHRLLLANLNALGAFAIAEQLGLSLGLEQVEKITFPIVHEKQVAHLLLQEYMLETVPIAILYREQV
jgi:hypothetical protein